MASREIQLNNTLRLSRSLRNGRENETIFPNWKSLMICAGKHGFSVSWLNFPSSYNMLQYLGSKLSSENFLHSSWARSFKPGSVRSRWTNWVAFAPKKYLCSPVAQFAKRTRCGKPIALQQPGLETPRFWSDGFSTGGSSLGCAWPTAAPLPMTDLLTKD